MRRALACLLPLLLGLSAASPPEPGEPVALLKGSDLAEFERVGLTPDSIAIVDGEVRLTGKPLGYFATKQDYRDYVLTFEWKYDRPEGLKSDAGFRGNSGLLVHIAKPHKVWPACIEVQLAQADPGAIFAVGAARFLAQSDPPTQKSAVKPVGEWNKMQVTCQGGTIIGVLNGVEVARGEKAEPAQGAIGWQSEGYPIRFREIRIKTLP
jgi:3-keto-disaccharide hydrolase